MIAAEFDCTFEIYLNLSFPNNIELSITFNEMNDRKMYLNDIPVLNRMGYHLFD